MRLLLPGEGIFGESQTRDLSGNLSGLCRVFTLENTAPELFDGQTGRVLISKLENACVLRIFPSFRRYLSWNPQMRGSPRDVLRPCWRCSLSSFSRTSFTCMFFPDVLGWSRAPSS